MTGPARAVLCLEHLPGLMLPLLLATATTDAVACDPSADDCDPLRFRIGAGVGVAQIDEDNVFLDTTSNAYRVFARYALSDHVSFELAAMSLDDIVEVYPLRTPTQTAVADASGVSLAAILTLPLSERFSLLGKAGALSWSADARDVDDTGVDPMLGLALEFRLTNALTVGIGYDLYRLGNVDSRVTTAQLSFGF